MMESLKEEGEKNEKTFRRCQQVRIIVAARPPHRAGEKACSPGAKAAILRHQREMKYSQLVYDQNSTLAILNNKSELKVPEYYMNRSSAFYPMPALATYQK